jgi:hypothetical protein
MKLLEPQQLRDQKEADRVRDLMRTKEMADAATKIRKELANAEADFKLMLSRNNHKWALELEAKEEELKALEREVAALENRKAQALIPIDLYKKQADELMVLAKSVMEEAKTKAQENEDLAELLEDKLDKAGQSFQDNIALRAKLEQREAGIVLQGQQVVEGNKALNKRINEFAVARLAAEKDIDERKTVLTLWDRTLVAKEEKLNNRTKELEVWAKQLVDQRETLERAMKRLSPLK